MNNFSKINPARAAMLIIDMEKAFVEPGAALCIAGAKASVPFIAQAAAVARECGAKIFWVKRIYAADGSDMERPRFLDLSRRGLIGAGVLAPNSTGLNSIEEPDGLVPAPTDITIIKPRFSAFFGTDLQNELKKFGIDTVILTGTTTPNCIRTTCYDAISYDFRTVVLEKCCSSNTPEIQAANIADMERIGAEIYRGEDFAEIFQNDRP